MGQQTEITVFLGSEPPSNSDLEKLESLFKAEYENIYGLSLDGMGLEVVAWRVSSFSPSDKRSTVAQIKSDAAAPKGRREVYFGDQHTPTTYTREKVWEWGRSLRTLHRGRAGNNNSCTPHGRLRWRKVVAGSGARQ